MVLALSLIHWVNWHVTWKTGGPQAYSCYFGSSARAEWPTFCLHSFKIFWPVKSSYTLNEMKWFAAYFDVLKRFMRILKMCFSVNQIDDLQSSHGSSVFRACRQNVPHSCPLKHRLHKQTTQVKHFDNQCILQLTVSPLYVLLAQTPLFLFFTIEEISVTYFKRTENLLIHAILNVNRPKCNKIGSTYILLRKLFCWSLERSKQFFQ